MPTTSVNGIELYWELNGDSGAPVVLVHGSWGDHNNWASVVPALSRSLRVLTYDRRGHADQRRVTAEAVTAQGISRAHRTASNGR
jgi:pimeloyl-ACP methyl ester carboxylesterase